MKDTPPPRSSPIVLTEELFDRLRARILSDEFTKGQRLPPERELAREYATNRNTLREAIRRLEQAGLVTVRQGQGVTVTDFRREGSLELLGAFLTHGSDVREKAEVLLGLLEPRAEILEYLVEASSKRAAPEDLDRIEATIAELKAAEDAKDEEAFVSAQHRWLNALVDSTHNLAFRWVANPFLESIRDMMARAKGLILFEPSLAAMAYEVLERARRGDAAGARAVTSDFHRTVDEKLRMILEPAAKKESAR